MGTSEAIQTKIHVDHMIDSLAKYCPIRVSSLIVCMFHQTLARRLDQVCPQCSRQKGFRPGHGIAENTVLLKEILR